MNWICPWLDISVSPWCWPVPLIAFLGSLGLLRLKSYFERVHAPAIIATMACWCVMHATLLYFSMVGRRPGRACAAGSPCSWPSPSP